VRNEPDGSVRVVAQGEEAALRALVRCLEKELPLARVDGVEVAWRDIVEPFLDFRIVCGWRTFF
jgi:acylphosphatase